MQTRSLLLRLLLCLTLVLNGVATAFAGTGTALAIPVAAAESARTGSHASPCHGGEMADAQAHDAVQPSHPSGDDCCAGLACLAHCLGTGQAAFLTVTWRWASMPVAAPEAPRRGQHGPPAIQHLLRPPIG